MSGPTLHGSTEWLEQPGGRQGWRQATGDFTTRVWEGPHSSVASFLINQLPKTGLISYEKELTGITTKVTAEYQTAQPGSGAQVEPGLIERYWELDGNDLELSLWRKPDVVAELDGLDVTAVAYIRSQVEKVVSGAAPDTGAPNKTREYLIRAFASGIESWEASQFVLRKTETVYRNTTISPNYKKTNYQFSYAALIAAEPSLASDNLIKAAELEKVMWVKRTPKVRRSAKNIWEVTLEYWGADAWNEWLHPYAVKPPNRPKAFIQL